MKMKKCLQHPEAVYTLKDSCPKCKKQTKEAHYKFVQIKTTEETNEKE